MQIKIQRTRGAERRNDVVATRQPRVDWVNFGRAREPRASGPRSRAHTGTAGESVWRSAGTIKHRPASHGFVLALYTCVSESKLVFGISARLRHAPGSLARNCPAVGSGGERDPALRLLRSCERRCGRHELSRRSGCVECALLAATASRVVRSAACERVRCRAAAEPLRGGPRPVRGCAKCVPVGIAKRQEARGRRLGIGAAVSPQVTNQLCLIGRSNVIVQVSAAPRGCAPRACGAYIGHTGHLH